MEQSLCGRNDYGALNNNDYGALNNNDYGALNNNRDIYIVQKEKVSIM